MGYGALIGGIISAVGGIASSALSSSGSSQANRNLTGEARAIGQARQQYIDPFTGAGFWNLDMPAALQSSIFQGEANAPGLNLFNQQQLNQLLGGAFPGGMQALSGMLGQYGKNIASELAGQVPADVQNQIQRFAAGQTITSGIGGGGGPGAAGAPFQLTDKTITARDLGLTSLSMMQQGQAGFGNLLGLTRNYLMPQPVNPLSLLPFQDIIAGQQWSKQAQFDANEAALTAAIDQAAVAAGLQPSISPFGQIAGGVGGLLQGLGQTSPQTGQTGYGMLGNLFSGFGGGGQTGSGIADQYVASLGLGGAGGAANFGY